MRHTVRDRRPFRRHALLAHRAASRHLEAALIDPFQRPEPLRKRSIDPERFRALVAATDAKYDAMMYPGMTMEEAFRVEQARDAEHQLIMRAAFELAFGK